MQVVDLCLSHNLAAGNELSKAFLVGKGIARTNGATTSVGAALTANVRVIRLCEGFLSEEALFHTTTIRKSRMYGQVVESDGYNWKEQNDQNNEHCKPKLTTAQCHSETAQILISDEIAIYKEGEGKIKRNAAPDDDVVEYGPVRRVEGDLRKRKLGVRRML